jgi:hypothetical protein
MAEDMLKHHFGPETGAPAPYISDAQIALRNIIDSYGISTQEVSEHPLTEDQIIDNWADESPAQ